MSYRNDDPADTSARGQIHTLEAVAAALVVLLGLFLALQVATTTPSAASTSSEYLGKEAANGAEGVLAAADERDALRGALLYWNTSTGSFHDVGPRGYYVDSGPPTEFGELLDETFHGRRIAYNVNLHYRTASGGRDLRRLVYAGHPNDNAVTASRVVTLYDRNEVRNASGGRTGTRLTNTTFYAPDVAPNTTSYNVVEVEVVVWRA